MSHPGEHYLHFLPVILTCGRHQNNLDYLLFLVVRAGSKYCPGDGTLVLSAAIIAATERMSLR